MTSDLFILSLAVLFAAFFTWSFSVLPRESWQIIASVPKQKTATGEWRGLNLTFYGFFMATSCAVAGAVLFALAGAIGVPAKMAFALLAAVFAVCLPAARLVARLVEKKAHTFTIGGALFVGVIVAPGLIALLNRIPAEFRGGEIPLVPMLAACAIAYAVGEGVGRLSCISFGCCYGKSLAQLNPAWRRLFAPICFRFTGSTKKVAYEGNLEGMPVVPIQAITAVIYVATALAGAYLFLHARFAAALLLTMLVTQLWRFLSEFLRADVRGGGKITAYQAMALAMLAYLSGLTALLPAAAISTDLPSGIQSLWNPALMLGLQCLWLIVFLYTGRSSVTGSTLSFHVHRDRI